MTENHKKGPMEAHKSTRHSFEWTIEKMSELQNMRGILRKKNISCESPVYEFSLSNAKIKLVFFLKLQSYQSFEIKMVQLTDDLNVDVKAWCSVDTNANKSRRKKQRLEKKSFVEKKCFFAFDDDLANGFGKGSNNFLKQS